VFKVNNKRLVSALILVSLLLLFSSLIPSLRKPLANSFRFPLTLFTLLRREAGGVIFYHRNLIQNEKLRSYIDFLRKKLNDSFEISQENARLKNLLSLKNNTPYKVITARVIGRDPSNWSSAIIIDKGSLQGVKKDCPSISFLGLVGRVVEVESSISKVMLINDPNLSVSAITQRSRQEGLVCGSLGGALIMKYLPKESDIKINDIVVSSGLTKIYPKGLLIGTVIDLGEEFSSLSKYAVVKPAVELGSLEEVLVIIP
jgi:rod shape-determining protein MreC